MKKNQVITLVAVVVILVSFFYTFQGSQDETLYHEEIEKEREEKDRFMRTSSASPFVQSKETYRGLRYFPPDMRYRIVANLTPVEQPKAVVLATNDGKEQRYVEYAYAEFKLEGATHRLLILEIADMGPFRGKLFLAFGDATSAGETYGGGRYLDVAKTPGSTTIKLDFNLAYNPYCAYITDYSCPFPPAENLLPIPIPAGEKVYHLN